MSRLRAVAAGVGLAVVAWLVWAIGPAALLARMEQLAWRLPIVLIPSALVAVIDAVSWRYAFPGRLPAPSLLVGARLAGEAVNDTTPTGTLGGEPLKAWLVAGAGIPLEDALVSIVVAKTVLVASQVGFLALGVALGSLTPTPPVLTSALALVGVAGAVAVGGFVWAQTHGLFLAGGRALGWLGLEGVASMATRLDVDVRAYYRRRRARFAGALVLHLSGWLAGSLETWLALSFLGAPVWLAGAVVVEAWATAIRSAGFMVPAAAGVQEGGLVLVFAGLGLSVETGLAFALIRRLREVVWVGAGYAVLAAWPGARRPQLGPGTP